MSRKNSGSTFSAANILPYVVTRSEWASRAVDVANPERVARIDSGTGKMYDVNGTVLRAYVNASGLCTMETNEEYRIRKNIATSAKVLRKSGSATSATPAPAKTVATSAISPEFTDDQLANVVNFLRSSGFTIVSPATTAPVAPVTSPAPGMTDSATKNASIRAIDRKLETLGKTREYVEKNAGYTLTSATVDQLRGINRVLGERIAKNASK
jgi:hypothetical protein